MTPPSPASAAGSGGIWRLVFLPAVVVTWAVILVRLGGELVEGPAWLFSRQGGGGAAVVGISWLVVVFGAYFGWRLARDGRGPRRHSGLALLVHVLAIAAGIGVMLGLGELGFLDFSKPNPTVAYCFAVVLGSASLVMLWSWPALFKAHLAYAILARLGIILVTIPAILGSWDTHFSKGPDGAVDPTWSSVVLASTAQVCFWIPFTILGGGLCGSIAALIASLVKPKQTSAAEMIGGTDIKLP